MDSCESRSRSTYNDGYRLGFYFKCLLVRHFIPLNINNKS